MIKTSCGNNKKRWWSEKKKSAISAEGKQTIKIVRGGNALKRKDNCSFFLSSLGSTVQLVTRKCKREHVIATTKFSSRLEVHLKLHRHLYQQVVSPSILISPNFNQMGKLGSLLALGVGGATVFYGQCLHFRNCCIFSNSYLLQDTISTLVITVCTVGR